MYAAARVVSPFRRIFHAFSARQRGGDLQSPVSRWYINLKQPFANIKLEVNTMRRSWQFLLAALTTASAASAAPKLGDFAPLDKESQSKLVFVYTFEPGAKNPRVPKPYKIIKGEGVTGGGGLVLSRPNPNDKYVFFKHDFKKLEPGRNYKLSVMTRVRGMRHAASGKPVDGKVSIVGFDFHGGGNYLGSSYIRSKIVKGEKDWTTEEMVFTMRKEYDRAQLVLFLKRPYTCRQVVWDNVKLERLGENLSIYPVLPKQLRLDPDGKVKLRVVDMGKARKLAAFAVTADGKELYAPVKGGFAEFALGELPEGVHKVKFFVADPKQHKVIAEAEFPFTVTSAVPPTGAVATDETGRLTVDGKPFFPLGFYLEWPNGFDAGHAKWLREAGANTVLPYRSYQMRLPESKGRYTVAALRRSLDFMRDNELKVIFGMLEVNTRSGITLNEFDGAKGRAAVIARIVEGIKDHPALLGWYISDENPISEMGKVSDLRFRISRRDPFHPVATLTNIADNYIWYGPTGDFMMIDPYPIVDESSQSMTRIRLSFEKQQRESRMGVWWVPQTFNWGIYRRTEKYSDFRYPTEEDMRAQLLLALNFRARGIIFYAYESIRRHDRFDPGASEWFGAQVKRISLLAKELTPFFLADGKPAPVKLKSTGASKVEAKLHTADGRSIVVITSDGPGEGAAVLDVGRDNLKSRFGKTTALGGGKYEFRGMNMSGDILE